MTLRVTLEIVPFGNEELKKKIYRLDISNVGVVKDNGFGHEVCNYTVGVYKMPPPIPGQSKEVEWEKLFTGYIEEFDRRDGAVALVERATKLVKEHI